MTGVWDWLLNERAWRASQKSRYTLNTAAFGPADQVRNVVIISDHGKRFNGGIKLYNLWAKLFNDSGLPTHIATPDGQYEPWLLHHQSVIKQAEIPALVKTGGVRLMTAWLYAADDQQIREAGPLCYFDAELAWTLQFRHRLEELLRRGMIGSIATHSRYIQSWYLANYGLLPLLVNEWSDERVFFADPAVRVPGRIGCMVSNPEEERIFRALQRYGEQSPACESVIEVKGDEASVAALMRTCDIFIGLNQGKHALWGEGCPRTQQEAIHSGCMLAAFDVLGNREYLYNGWTGILVERGAVDDLWQRILQVLQDAQEKERLRQNGRALVQALFTAPSKLPLAKQFLRLI